MTGLGRPSYHFIRIDLYIKYKIKVLRQLGIRLTKAEKDHMKSLKTEIAVDNYARSLLFKENLHEKV